MTISSVSFFCIVFLLFNQIYFFKSQLGVFWWIIIFIYISIPFVLAFITLLCCRVLSADKLSNAKNIETSNNDFLANYLSFFFVAMSVKSENMILFYVVFGMTVLFTFFSRVSYFNPTFLIFGFNFYYVQTIDNVKVMLITKKKLKNPKDLIISHVKRINDYTFIEI